MHSKTKIFEVLILTLIALLLSGCFPVAYVPTDPTQAQATQDVAIAANAARMTQEAAQPYLDATTTVEARAYAQATLQAASTMDALGVQLTLAAADLEHTQIAYTIQQTQIVDTAIAAEATRVAGAYLAQTQMAAPVTATALAIVQASEERTRQRVELEETVAIWIAPIKAAFWLALPLIVIGLIVFGGVYGFRKLFPVLEARSRYIRQANGQMLYLSGGGDNVILTNTPTATPYGPSVHIRPGGVVVEGVPSPVLQSETNFQAFAVALARSLPQSNAGRDELEKLLKQLENRMSIPQGQQAVLVNDMAYPAIPGASSLPAVAPWEIMQSYRGNGFPVGLLESGELLDPSFDDAPHRLFAGATGAGKSRRGSRPAIAIALTQGFIVFSLGDMPTPDFSIFDGHPNYHSAVVDAPEDMIKYIESANVEVKKRWQFLYQNNASTWSRLMAAPPRVMIVIDEYPAIVDNLDGKDAKTFQKRIANLSRLSRKAGIHLLLGAQNPTAESIRPSIRRNMLSVYFRMADPAASLAVVGVAGAERLGDRQFLSRTLEGEVKRGVAFDPSDDQIMGLINGRQGQAHELPDWLSNPPALPSGEDESGDNDGEFVAVEAPAVAGPHERDEKIIGYLRQGMTQAQIEAEVFGYNGGKAYRIVSQVIANYLRTHPQNVTTTTTAG